ncbi:MAG: hypothetical protein NTW52_14400 [Planctomycetota bacterium]|nr:hypothetical protein [Planctomycetota bacterium]
MASLSATEKKKPGNRFRSDSDAVTLPEAAANPLRDYILESARTIHRTELTMAFLRWMLSVVAVFFSLVLIDQWLWPLSTVARYVVWVGFIGGTLLWFTTMVLPLIGRTIHPHYAARQIETTLPEMKEGLITWVQLSGSDTPPPKSVLNAVGRYVAKQLKGQDIASVIDQLNPLKLAAALMGLTLIGAIYLATSPKNVPATIQRLLMPWANIAPATRVQIVSITPGDTSVIQGSNASIAIQVRGWQRQDKATIRYATDDGQTVDQRVAMSSDIEGLSYRIELGKSFGGILQPMHYWVEAGDAIAGPFAIQVQAIPLSTLERVDYVYPAYTRMSPRTIESDGRIEGPEGTRVRVTARGNQPMKSARVEFDSTLAQDGSYQPEWIRDLQVDDRSISGDWILEVNEKRSNPSRYQYRIRSTNMLGESAPEPVVYPMMVVADMAPEVDFAAEIKDIIVVAENSSIDLEMRANDPDFGLVKLVLDGTAIGSKNRGSVLQETLIEDAAGLTGQSVHTIAVAPKQLGLQSGDKIDLVLTASDNRHDPQTSKPAPNVVKSRVVTLKVTPPVKNPNPTNDASGGKQKNQSKDPSQPDNTPKSKPSSDPQQPNEKNSKEKPANSNEKPSGEQKPNKEDQAKQDRSKQASDQANGAQKDDVQSNKSQEKTPAQPKPTPNQPRDNPADQPQEKDQPPRDQKQQPSNKKPEQQPKDSQSKDQSGKDQSGKDQGSGDDPSGASESSDSSGGQPQGSQKSAGGKSGGKSANSSGDSPNDSPNDSSGEPSEVQSQGAPGAGKESPSGSQSPSMKSDPSDPSDPQSSGSKADPSESNASDGDASDWQTPTHDGEAFERLQKILNQSKSSDGTNGKSTRDQDPSDDKNEQTKDPQASNSGKPSTDQSKTSKSPKKAPDISSSQDNATDQKSGDSSSGQAGNKQQRGDPKDDSASNGNKIDSPSSDSPGSDSEPSNQPNKSDTGQSDPGKSDPAKSNSDDKSKANESSGGDDSKASSDKGNPNQSKTSPNSSPSGEESMSVQESKPNDSNANESNSKHGRDKSASGTPNNPKPENSNAKNSQPESNKPETKQPQSSDSKSSDPAGSKSMSGQSGEKGASSDPSQQDASNSSSSKSNEGDSAKGNPSKSDSKPSEGKSQDASSKGSQSEGSGKAKGSSGDSKSSSGSSKSSGASSGGSQGMNSSGESGTAAGIGAGGNESSVRFSEETKEYAKSATDLVLDSLKRQREQPDPELLKRMGWNKEQMQAFVDRWQAAREKALIDPSKKKDYEDMLQSLGLVPQTGSTRAVLGRTDSLTGIREEGSRVRPPESLRERFEAFRKASQNAGAK